MFDRSRGRAVASVAVLAAACTLIGACGSGNSTSAGSGSSTSASSGARSLDPPGVRPLRRNIKISVAIIGISGVKYFVPIEKGAKQAATDMGVSLDYQSTQTFDVQDQIRLIKNAIARKPDGLVVSIVDPGALKPVLSEVKAAGIPFDVIVIGRAAAKQFGALTFAGPDQMLSGTESGQEFTNAGVTSAVCLNQAPGNADNEQRCVGFKKTFRGKVAELPVPETDQTAMTNSVKAYMQSHPDVTGYFGLASTATEAAMDASAALGNQSKVTIGGIDLSPRVLEGVRDGKVLFATDQEQYLQAYDAVQALVLYRQYAIAPPTELLTGPFLVTKDTAARVIDLSAQGYR